MTRVLDWILIAGGRVGGRSFTTSEAGKRAASFLKGWQQSVRGATVYLGAPSSRQRLRVYDKYKESQGKTNSIRWELQCREQAAESMLHQLAEAGDGWPIAARNRLVAFIDFREAGTESHTDRRPRLKW